MKEEKMDNWKQFQGSELGTLMAGLYGGKKNRPNIVYPKVKKSKPVDPGKWRPVSNLPGAVDPRKTTRRNVKVNVPKGFGNKYEVPSLIDCISRRKNESNIKEEIEDIQMRQKHYRPAHTRLISGENEKEKLSQIFTHKGGVCLPEELRAIESEAPFEIERRIKKEKQMQARQALVNQRKGLPSALDVMPTKVLGHSENMANQITQEIDERVDYLEAMKGMKQLQKQDEKRIQGEIRARIVELHKLQAQDNQA